ncbi:MAG: HYR domain-containing protein [Saprospiraceae bacterium]
MKFQSFSSAFWLCLFFLANSFSAFAEPDPAPTNNTPGDPIVLGHCQPIVIADTNCVTHTIELSAFVSWIFTGLLEPVVATWTTGEVAHKITVVPPGNWAWDPTITSCEPFHYHTDYKQPGTFFLGTINIQGPASICVGSLDELVVESGGYNFTTFNWDPANPSGTLSPYEISAPGTYTLTVNDDLGCPFTDQITVTTSTVLLETTEQFFCPGESITINGVVYNQTTTVLDTLPSNTMGCDTIVKYTLTFLPVQTYSDSLVLCIGDSITIGGQVYTQSGIVVDTIPAGAIGCDTIITYTLTFMSNQVRSESISFCPGSSVSIGGQIYTQSGIVVDTISGIVGCDTIVTYTLTLLPQPARSEGIEFCPGETISLGGTNYTQPGIVVLTIPSNSNACDTIVTYTLSYLSDAPSTVNITCPAPITVSLPNSNSGTVVNYDPPSASTDCPCPGLTMALTSGLSTGSNFPQGATSVCFSATDVCGQSNTCCFTVTVEEATEVACDVKVNGCVKYELLSITKDQSNNRTYSIRVTNNCTAKMIYTAMGLPSGIVAIAPANQSTYTAPSGNTYLIRNPSFAPIYSIRFSGVSDKINNGESDIFKYTLPAQAQVQFIHVVTRLEPNTYVEAYLDTYNCPVGNTPSGARPFETREETLAEIGSAGSLFVYPNPASQIVQVETGGQSGELILLDATGRLVLRQKTDAQNLEFSVAEFPNGLYQAIFSSEKSVLYGSLVVQH